jgi:hypothetical protein
MTPNLLTFNLKLPTRHSLTVEGAYFLGFFPARDLCPFKHLCTGKTLQLLTSTGSVQSWHMIFNLTFTIWIFSMHFWSSSIMYKSKQ